jgi:hypothetical protein
MFSILQNPAGLYGRKNFSLQAPTEAHFVVRAHDVLASSLFPAATRQTYALNGGAAEEADAGVRWPWQFAGVGRAASADGRRILPGSGQRWKRGGRRRPPQRDLAHD